jgi:hypothetical protein
LRLKELLPDAGSENPIQPAHPVSFYATDSIEKFRTLGAQFLGQSIGEVLLVDLGG